MNKLELLSIVKEKAESCVKCNLCKTRNKIVFGEGNENALIFSAAESPGHDEDMSGRPYVGRAGKEFEKLIAEVGWKREDLYIANVLKCRPPENRNPTPEEAHLCRDYLFAQIKIVNPKFMICWGKIASFYILGGEDKIEHVTMSRYRGVVHDYNGIKVVSTYHPSYLFRNPSKRNEVIEDLKILKGLI